MIPVELKCPAGKTHVQYLRDGVVPIEYRPQVLGQMSICNSDVGFFMSYCPGHAPLIVEVDTVNEVWAGEYADKVDANRARFVEELDEICKKFGWPRHEVPAIGSRQELKVHDVEQGTPEWLELRLGVPTASRFKDFITPAKGDYSKGKGKETYINQLIDERVRGLASIEVFDTEYMARGRALEPEAFDAFRLVTDLDVQPIGCVTHWGCLASPDGVILEGDNDAT